MVLNDSCLSQIESVMVDVGLSRSDNNIERLPSSAVALGLSACANISAWAHATIVLISATQNLHSPTNDAPIAQTVNIASHIIHHGEKSATVCSCWCAWGSKRRSKEKLAFSVMSDCARSPLSADCTSRSPFAGQHGHRQLLPS